MKSLSKKMKGFTLIELMVVLAIIGILAAIAIPNFLRYQLRSKFSELKNNVTAVFKSEESLKQNERRLCSASDVTGQYVAFPYAVPQAAAAVVCATADATKKQKWIDTDFLVAQTIDWNIQGSTYGIYNAAVAGGSGATCTVATKVFPFGLSLSVGARADIDGDQPTGGFCGAVCSWQPQLKFDGPVAMAPPNCPGGAILDAGKICDITWVANDPNYPVGNSMVCTADNTF